MLHYVRGGGVFVSAVVARFRVRSPKFRQPEILQPEILQPEILRRVRGGGLVSGVVANFRKK